MSGMMRAAAQKAAEVQRSTFMRMLRVGDVIQPSVQGGPAADAHAVKAAISDSADALIARHESKLPEGCERAPAHLSMAACAVASQRVLLREAQSADAHKVCSIVAGALGVFVRPDGSDVAAVPVMWLPNRLASVFSGAVLFRSRKLALLERLIGNYERDLGAAFELEQLDPPPSRMLRRCFYHEFCEAEEEAGGNALVLAPVFQAIHAATFSGVPGFDAQLRDGGRVEFRFTA